MKILYINNDGGGFADHIEVADGITIERFFSEQLSDCRPQDYLIRVNRQSAAANQVLCAWLLRRRRWAKSISVPDALFEHVTTLSTLSDYAVRHGWMLAVAETQVFPTPTAARIAYEGGLLSVADMCITTPSARRSS